jgi:tyrosinase
MGTQPTDEPVVDNPTYMGNIRYFFETEDIEHMAAKGIDLATYDGVKAKAGPIYIHTLQPGGDMPPDPARQWSAARSQTFKNWILTHFPMGTAPVATYKTASARFAAAPDRLRKDVSKLSQPEIDVLAKAFQGLMAKDPSDPNSYCALAGIHGLPESWCLHHEDRFNPWHRVYLKLFEDALRSVPGCENVTLPYWDIKTAIPALLKTAPFDSYVVPIDLGSPYGKNYKTRRYDQSRIDQLLEQYDVIGDLDTALTQSLWGASGLTPTGFQGFSIAGHDGGHGSIGPTMGDQNVSSFDPIFWFFHCNLDRHWLSWQTNMGATTLTGFKSTLRGNIDWLSDPVIYALSPWTMTSDTTIDNYGGIGYDQLMGPTAMAAAFENKVGSLAASQSFTIRRSTPISVQVKNIDRLNIPGSFSVTLLADGQPVAKRAFFQPNKPRDCATCRKIGLVSLNFRVPADKILDKKLSVEIDVQSQEAMGTRFPLSSAGNPTINARLLLEDG